MVKDGGLMSHKLDVLSMESKVEKKKTQKYMDIAKRQNKKSYTCKIGTENSRI